MRDVTATNIIIGDNILMSLLEAGETEPRHSRTDLPDWYVEFIMGHSNSDEVKARRREQWGDLPPRARELLELRLTERFPTDVDTREYVTSVVLDVMAGLDSPSEAAALEALFAEDFTEINPVPEVAHMPQANPQLDDILPSGSLSAA